MVIVSFVEWDPIFLLRWFLYLYIFIIHEYALLVFIDRVWIRLYCAQDRVIQEFGHDIA